jgi:hypothetical protein
MATYAQLQQETWWWDEFQPDALVALCRRLRAHYDLPADAVGSKGNNRHLQGYHRSRNWIKNSTFCTNRTYSVSRTPGDRDGGDKDWICAVDISLPPAQLLPTCKRLDTAVRAGHLEKITEWYGNTNGDERVDGYDNIANMIAASDPSHFTHLHLSFDRGRADEDHSDLFAILTGTEGDDEDMPWDEKTSDDVAFTLLRGSDGKPIHVRQDLAQQALTRIEQKLTSPPPATPVTVDATAVAAALAANTEFLAAIAKAVADEDHRRSAG